jgi:glycerate dehydrogenase
VALRAAELAAAPRLRLVCLAATGTDNVDLATARTRGIAVANIRNYCAPSVTQHVFALVLALTQHLREYHGQVAAGAWARAPNFCLLEPRFAELAGKTLGLVGFGNLGRSVAAVARAFGMRVIAAARPYRGTPAPPAISSEGVERVGFEALLAQADVISLHCPLTEETRNLFDGTALARMKRTALLINTARGALVDAAALADALQRGVIAGAGIDVLAEEPPVRGSPLIDAGLPNLIVTPHMAWAARESRQRALDEIAANVAAFLRGERRNRVD